jgi:MFS family permease
LSHAPSLTTARSPALVGVLVLATVSTVFPGFLIGALSVQVRDEFGLSETAYGWGLGSFFLAAAAGSVVLGRVGQRIGPRHQIRLALAVTAAAEVTLAVAGRSFGSVLACLVVCGFANAGNQTAVNLALSRADLPRLGLALALKQSGMPLAAMLSGLAVPVLALTVGWRWAFASGAGVTLVALIAVHAVLEPAPLRAETSQPPLRSTQRVLTVAAICSGLLAFSAGALNAWVVESGVDAGLAPGTAGFMLSIGAGAGIVLRLTFGLRIDSMRLLPFRAAGATAFIGAAGMVLLGVRASGVHIAATVIAFGGGWVWPVFTNFGIVRTNGDASGAATGVTQMGVYVGVFSAPLLTGFMIEEFGYRPMWIVVAISAVLGAAVAFRIAPHFPAESSTRE